MVCFSFREGFTLLCLEFQKGISQGEDDELGSLLSERELLENEIGRIRGGNAALTYSTPAYMEEFLSDIHDSNTGNIESWMFSSAFLSCKMLHNFQVLLSLEYMLVLGIATQTCLHTLTGRVGSRH